MENLYTIFVVANVLDINPNPFYIIYMKKYLNNFKNITCCMFLILNSACSSYRDATAIVRILLIIIIITN